MQGVSYRACAREEAQRLAIMGWVKNLPDGDVEAVAEGEPEALDAFVRWCHRGPQHAEVESVASSDDTSATGEFTSFEVKR